MAASWKLYPCRSSLILWGSTFPAVLSHETSSRCRSFVPLVGECCVRSRQQRLPAAVIRRLDQGWLSTVNHRSGESRCCLSRSLEGVRLHRRRDGDVHPRRWTQVDREGGKVQRRYRGLWGLHLLSPADDGD